MRVRVNRGKVSIEYTYKYGYTGYTVIDCLALAENDVWIDRLPSSEVFVFRITNVNRTSVSYYEELMSSFGFTAYIDLNIAKMKIDKPNRIDRIEDFIKYLKFNRCERLIPKAIAKSVIVKPCA